MSQRFNTFMAAGPGDSRSPCPALNALSNHSYIPHSGRSIPLSQLVHAMREVYNVSAPLAWLLSIVGFLVCGHFTGSGFSTRLALDLHDLARHGRIEHDGSLAHADAVPGEQYAPSVPDRTRLNNLLNGGRKTATVPGSLTLYDLANVRFERDRALSVPLGAVHAEITRGEVALTALALGVEGSDAEGHVVISHDRLVQWFGEERLPDGWTIPRVQIGLWRTMRLSRRVRGEVARLARYS